jgi:hypothetical protein
MRIVVALGVIFGLVLLAISGLLKVLRGLYAESTHPAPTLLDSTSESGFSSIHAVPDSSFHR